MSRIIKYTRDCVPPEELASRAARMGLSEHQLDLLFFSQNNTAKQISELLGIPVGTVKSRLHRARAKLVGGVAK